VSGSSFVLTCGAVKKTPGFAREPIGVGLAHEGDDVVDDAASGGPNLGGLDPFVFGEASGNDDMLVIDDAGSGNIVGTGS